ncbi:MAG TPA: phospholipase D family protein [Solirubrobacterales bacterium]
MTVAVVRPKVIRVNDLVPSTRWPSGFAALRAAVESARSVSLAVAFVTEPGVTKLAELIKPLGEIDLEVVARAGGVTTPAALYALRDQLGAQVSVAIGLGSARFHPKLWLARGESELAVLSGSGNLTLGGLEDNDEQFELTRMALDSDEANEQEERFVELTAGTHPLEAVEGTVVWDSWLMTITKSKVHRGVIRRLEEQLDAVPVKSKPEKERQQLLADLYEIYEETVAKDMLTPKGNLYRPTRFLVGINRARDGGDPFELVRRLCRRQTGGFDIILKHDEPLLTVEALVVDKQKPYHYLFAKTTRELAAKRLVQFPSWSK